MNKTIQWIIDNILPLVAGILLAIGVDESIIADGKDLILQIIGLIAAVIHFVKKYREPGEIEKAVRAALEKVK